MGYSIIEKVYLCQLNRIHMNLTKQRPKSLLSSSQAPPISHSILFSNNFALQCYFIQELILTIFLCVFFMLRCLGSTRHNETETKYNHQMVQCEGYLLPILYLKNKKWLNYTMSFVCHIIKKKGVVS